MAPTDRTALSLNFSPRALFPLQLLPTTNQSSGCNSMFIAVCCVQASAQEAPNAFFVYIFLLLRVRERDPQSLCSEPPLFLSRSATTTLTINFERISHITGFLFQSTLGKQRGEKRGIFKSGIVQEVEFIVHKQDEGRHNRTCETST